MSFLPFYLSHSLYNFTQSIKIIYFTYYYYSAAPDILFLNYKELLGIYNYT